MNITIQNEFASVTCRTLGAELLSYKTAAGKEYMWQKDPAYWAKTSPVLFPYIGAVPETVTIHGVDYKIPRHGFVKDAESGNRSYRGRNTGRIFHFYPGAG